MKKENGDLNFSEISKKRNYNIKEENFTNLSNSLINSKLSSNNFKMPYASKLKLLKQEKSSPRFSRVSTDNNSFSDNSPKELNPQFDSCKKVEYLSFKNVNSSFTNENYTMKNKSSKNILKKGK